MTAEAVAETVYQQIHRLDGSVKRLGGEIVHVKPHGALYNVAVRNAEVARAIAQSRYAPFDADRLDRAGMLISIAPGRVFSRDERETVASFVRGGDTVGHRGREFRPLTR